MSYGNIRSPCPLPPHRSKMPAASCGLYLGRVRLRYVLSGFPEVSGVGEPPVELGQLLQHVRQLGEGGPLPQVVRPARRQDLLHRVGQGRAGWWKHFRLIFTFLKVGDDERTFCEICSIHSPSMDNSWEHFTLQHPRPSLPLCSFVIHLCLYSPWPPCPDWSRPARSWSPPRCPPARW